VNFEEFENLQNKLIESQIVTPYISHEGRNHKIQINGSYTNR